MSSLPFDPFRAELRCRCSNAWIRWRADWRQAAVHGVASVLLLMLLLPPLHEALRAGAPLLQHLIERWPLTLAATAWLLFALQQARGLQSLRERQDRHWLRAQPVTPTARSRLRRDALTLRLAVQLGLGGGLLALAQAGPRVLLAFALCAVAAGISAPAFARVPARLRRMSVPLDPRVRDAGPGRFWRWQRIEAGIGLRGPQLAPGLWALLLVPLASGLGAVLAIGLTGLLVTLLATAWRRSLAVLPRAQRWLAAQPLTGAALLRATVLFPFVVLAGSALLLALFVASLGAPGLGVMLALALLLLGGLQFACTAAERRRPRRIGLSFVLHLVLLVAVAQAVPPLLIVSFPLQLAWLLRRALQS